MPPTALTAPMAITTIAQVVPAGAARSKKTSIRPKTATLSIAPESIAEPFGGATGCARGNQKWSGNSPALDPNPNSASPSAALRHVSGSCGAAFAIAANDVSPACAARIPSAPSIPSAPAWLTIRYEKTARRTTRTSTCAPTSTTEASAISSQDSMNAATDRAISTAAIAAANAAMPHPYRPSGAFQTATAIVSTPSSAKNGEANGTRPQSKTNPGTIEPTWPNEGGALKASQAKTRHTAPTNVVVRPESSFTLRRAELRERFAPPPIDCQRDLARNRGRSRSLHAGFRRRRRRHDAVHGRGHALAGSRGAARGSPVRYRGSVADRARLPALPEAPRGFGFATGSPGRGRTRPWSRT